MTMKNPAFVLITGASYGLGEEYALQLAQRGKRLLLTARSQARLESLRPGLLAAGAPEVRLVTADLAADGVEVLTRYIAAEQLEIELLINNAGFGGGGEFARCDAARQLAMIDVNVRALVALSRALLPAMRERQSGAIMNLGSVASFQPGPYGATYAATKAFVLSFSLALWQEYREYGVHIMAVCPGYTDTHFFEAANLAPPRGVYMQSAAQVVRESLRALDRRKPYVVTGAPNRWLVRASRVSPRLWAVKVTAKWMRTRWQR